MSNQLKVYLPGLNGIRAIAALAVVFSHTVLSFPAFGLHTTVFGVDSSGHLQGIPLAGHGVTMFFTLSGFLITYLLLLEKETGSINIRDFYIRRILRIWPLYYLYLFIGIIVLVIFNYQFPWRSMPFYVFLAANIPFTLHTSIPIINHFWSIGVEEQFYLFFPHLAKLQNRKFLSMLIVLLGIMLIAKLSFYILSRKGYSSLPLEALNVTSFHIMFIGAIGGVLFYLKNPLFIKITTHIATQIICWIIVFLIAINKFTLPALIHPELVSLSTLCIIIGQISGGKKVINLENGILNFLGKISYGIYIIHVLVLVLLSKMWPQLNDNVWTYIWLSCLVLFLTVTLSYLSYEYYEKPFLRLKSRFGVIKSGSDNKS